MGIAPLQYASLISEKSNSMSQAKPPDDDCTEAPQKKPTKFVWQSFLKNHSHFFDPKWLMSKLALS